MNDEFKVGNWHAGKQSASQPGRQAGRQAGRFVLLVDLKDSKSLLLSAIVDKTIGDVEERTDQRRGKGYGTRSH